jgi:hypothetical protein
VILLAVMLEETLKVMLGRVIDRPGLWFGVFEWFVYAGQAALTFANPLQYVLFLLLRVPALLLHAATDHMSGGVGVATHFVFNVMTFVGASAWAAASLVGASMGDLAKSFLIDGGPGEVEALLKVWPLIHVTDPLSRAIILRSMFFDIRTEWSSELADLFEWASSRGVAFGSVFLGGDDLLRMRRLDEAWLEVEDGVDPDDAFDQPGLFQGLSARVGRRGLGVYRCTNTFDEIKGFVSLMTATVSDAVDVSWPPWATTAFRLLVAAGATRVFREYLVPSAVKDVLVSMALVGLKPGDLIVALEDVARRVMKIRGGGGGWRVLFERSPKDPVVILHDVATAMAKTDDDLVPLEPSEDYFRPRVEHLEGLIERVRVAMRTADVAVKASLNIALRGLLDRQATLEQLAVQSCPRKPPLAVLVAGPPGVGKSFLLRVWFAAAAAVLGRSANPACMYNVSQDQVYYDDYRTLAHWFVVLDDMMNVNPDKVTDATKLMAQIFAFINSAPGRLNAAEIENKQKRWAAPDVVIGTTNVGDLNAHAYGVHNGVAIRRRFEWRVDVVVKPEYRKDGSSELDVSKFGTEPIPDAWEMTIKRISANGQGVAETKVASKVSFEEVVRWFATTLSAHRGTSQAAVEALDRACARAIELAKESTTLGAHATVAGSIAPDEECITINTLAAATHVPTWWRERGGSWWTYSAYSHSMWLGGLCFMGGKCLWSYARYGAVDPRVEGLFRAFVFDPVAARHTVAYSLWRQPGLSPSGAREVAQAGADVAVHVMLAQQPWFVAQQGVRMRRLLMAVGGVGGVALAVFAARRWARPTAETKVSPTMLRELPAVVAENPSGWQRENARDAVGDDRVPASDAGRVGTAPTKIFKDPLPIQGRTTPLDVLTQNLLQATEMFWFGTREVIGSVTAIGGFLYVTAGHNLQSQRRDGGVIQVGRHGDENGFLTEKSVYTLDSRSIYFVPGRDLAFITLTRAPRKSLEELFVADQGALQELARCGDVLFAERDGEFGARHRLRRALSKGLHLSKLLVMGLDLPIDPAQPHLQVAGETTTGTSGALALLDAGRVRVMAGVLTFSGASGSIVTPVYASDIVAAKRHLWVEKAGVISAPCFGRAYRGEVGEKPHYNSWVNYASHVSFAGHCLGYARVREKPKMTFHRTPWYAPLAPLVNRTGAHFAAPAVGTSPVLVGGQVEFRSTYLNVARSFCHRTPPPAHLVEIATNDFFREFPDPPAWVRPLTANEAVFGIPGLIDSVQAGTSSGQWGGSKRAWINFESKEISPQLEEAIYSYLASLDTLTITEAMYFSYKHKDEGRGVGRVVDFKTRFFNVGDLHIFIAMRMLFAPYLAWLRTLDPDITECAVGVNAVSTEWEKLMRPLSEFSDNVICGDLSDYDKVADPIFAVGVSVGVGSVLRRGCGYSERDVLRLQRMLALCFFPVTMIDTALVVIEGSSPSGMGGTSQFNCHRGALESRVAMLKLTAERNELIPLLREVDWFRRRVKARWYGDDHIMASRAPWYNQVALQRVMALWGEKYTDANKNPTLAEFTTWSDATFLKRRILQWGGLWLAPLEKKSIIRCCAYAVESSVGPMSRDAEALPNAIAEAWLHRDDPAFFEELRTTLLNAMPMSYADGGTLTLQLHTAAELEDIYRSDKYATWDGGNPTWRSFYTAPTRDVDKSGPPDEACLVSITNRPTRCETFHPTCSSMGAHCPRGHQSYLGRGEHPPDREWIVTDRGERQINKTYISCLCGALYHTTSGAAAPLSTVPMEGSSTAIAEATLLTQPFDATNVMVAEEGAPGNDTGFILTEAGTSAKVQTTPLRPGLSDPSTLGEWWSRQVEIYNATWSLAAFTVVLDPWSAYLHNFAVVRKASNFARLRAGMEITVMTGGTGFHYGRYRVFYVPRALERPGTTGATFLANLDPIMASQCAGVDVDICGSSTVTLQLPFISPYEWINLETDPVYSTGALGGAMGRLVLYPLTPLGHITLVTPPPVPVTVLARLVNPTFALPTNLVYATVTSGRASKESEPKASYSRPLATLAAAASAIGTFPAAAPVAMPVAAMATAASKIASALGYSKPVDEGVQQVVVGVPWRNTGTYSGTDWVTPAGLDPAGTVAAGGAAAGEESDEMSFNYILTRWSLILPYRQWSPTNGAGTILCTIPVTPQAFYYRGADVSFFRPTWVGSLAWMFRAWRGSLVYKVQVVASKFHQGRLQIVYRPSTSAFGALPSTMLKNIILDLSERTEVTFTVGYAAPTATLAIAPFAQRDLVKVDVTGSPVSTNTAVANGQIQIVSLTPLAAPLTTNNVSVLISVKAGDDFEYIGFDPRGLSPYGATSQIVSITSGKAYPTTESVELVPKLTGPDVAAFASERFVHLRPLLERYLVRVEMNLGRPVSTDYGSSLVRWPGRDFAPLWKFTNAQRLAMYRPSFAPWLNAAQNAITTLNFLPLDYLRLMYAGERGGFRHRFHHVEFGQPTRMETSVQMFSYPSSLAGQVVTTGEQVSAGLGASMTLAPTSTDGYAWGGDAELSPTGVSIPYIQDRYYIPGNELPSWPLAGVAGGAGPGGNIDVLLYRKFVNSATTEGTAANGTHCTNSFAVLSAVGDDFSLVCLQYTPLFEEPGV